MKNKKLILSIMLIAVVIIIGIIILNNRLNYKIEKIEEIKYNILEQNKKYGVIDNQGNVLIESIYDNIQIPNPSKPVFICMKDYDMASKQYNIKVYNDRKEEILGQYSDVQALPTEITSDGIPYEKSVLRYKENDKYGLISLEGKKIIDPIYDSITAMNLREGILLVKKDDKFGLINIKGKVVINPAYDQITVDSYYISDSDEKDLGFIVKETKDESYKYGYFTSKGKKLLDTEYSEIRRINEIKDDKHVYLFVSKNGQEGIVKDKKTVLKCEYEDISYNAYNNMFIIQKNSKRGIANIKGKVIISPQYDNILFGGMYINAVKDGNIKVLTLNGQEAKDQSIYSKTLTDDKKYYIAIDKNEVYKVMNSKDEVIIDNNFTYIEYIRDGYFIVAKDGKNGIINSEGKSIADLEYNSIFKLNKTDIIQANLNLTNTATFYDKGMNNICEMQDTKIINKDNYIQIENNTERRYFDFSGRELQYKEIEPNNKLYASKVNDKWGFVDTQGNVVVKNEYEMVTEFNKQGFAGIKKDGLWGVIDLNGEIIQKPIYDIKWSNPNFIGKYYEAGMLNTLKYYSDKI